MSLKEQEVLKMVGILVAERSSVGCGLTLNDHKRNKLSARVYEKDDFKNHW